MKRRILSHTHTNNVVQILKSIFVMWCACNGWFSPEFSFISFLRIFFYSHNQYNLIDAIQFSNKSVKIENWWKKEMTSNVKRAHQKYWCGNECSQTWICWNLRYYNRFYRSRTHSLTHSLFRAKEPLICIAFYANQTPIKAYYNVVLWNGGSRKATTIFGHRVIWIYVWILSYSNTLHSQYTWINVIYLE